MAHFLPVNDVIVKNWIILQDAVSVICNKLYLLCMYTDLIEELVCLEIAVA